MKTTHCLLLVLALSCSYLSAASIYTMDFSVAGQGATHVTESGPSPTAGENWQLTYPAPETDSSMNEFVTVGGLMRVQDWGGEGTITSDTITILSNGTVSISGVGETIGDDVFNASSEGVSWFYSLNGDVPVNHFIGQAQLGGSDVVAGVDIGYAFFDIPVTIGDTLKVGFTVDVNGADDGVEVSSLAVDFTAIPEPTSSIFLAFAGSACLFLRNRRS